MHEYYTRHEAIKIIVNAAANPTGRKKALYRLRKAEIKCRQFRREIEGEKIKVFGFERGGVDALAELVAQDPVLPPPKPKQQPKKKIQQPKKQKQPATPTRKVLSLKRNKK